MKLPETVQRKHLVLLGFNVVYLLIFAYLYWLRRNGEFLMYVVTVSLSVTFVAAMYLRYRFPFGLLLGLSTWGLLHMLGGSIRIGDDVLYGLQLIPHVLRFDQFVHAFGFGCSTLLCYYVLVPSLGAKVRWFGVTVIVVLAGMGIGALNEIVEFVAVLTLPETGVGGYENTMWDIVFNTFGAMIAMTYATIARKRVPGNG